MRHRVRKLVFELGVDKTVDAFAIQQIVSDHFWEDLMPEMVKLFDEISDPNHLIKIDRLELRLGTLSEAVIDSGDWTLLFREALQNALGESIDLESRKVKRIDSPDECLEQWLYFISHGYLPWNAAKPASEWLTKVLESIAANDRSAFKVRRLILQNANVASRIVRQQEPGFLTQLVEALSAEKQTELSSSVLEMAVWLEGLHKLKQNEATRSKQEIAQKAWIAILQKVALQSGADDTHSILKHLLAGWLQLGPPELIALTSVSSFKGYTSLLYPVINDMLKGLPRAQTESLLNDVSDHPDEPVFEQLAQRLEEQNRRDEDQPEQDHSTEEGIYVTNACVVLLHPF